MGKFLNISMATGGLVTISATVCKLGKVPKATIDVAPMAGEKVRIWLDADKKYSTDARRNHYWQVAEFVVPPRQYNDSEGVAADGKPTMTHEAVPLDMTSVEITVWPLPE